MYENSLKPYGHALLDYFNSGLINSSDPMMRLKLVRDDGLVKDVPIRSFFHGSSDFSLLEKAALDRCKGDVLDIGAGAGRFVIELQKRGFTVNAVDVCQEACEVMQAQGIEDVQCVDIFKLGEKSQKFDTLLLMKKGIGIVENITGLDKFLTLAHELLKPDGQVLLDSLDFRFSEDIIIMAYYRANQQEGRYGGELRLQYEYKGEVGPTFRRVLVDRVMLVERAQKHGWDCQIIHKEDSGMYLARLTRLEAE